MAKLLQLVHMQDGFTVVRLLGNRICIECGQHIQAVLLKTLIAHQRLTQTACTNQHGIGGIVIAKKLLNVIDQTLT